MSIGQIMAECDCTHEACESRGYCMAARIAELEDRCDWNAAIEAAAKVADSYHRTDAAAAIRALAEKGKPDHD